MKDLVRLDVYITPLPGIDDDDAMWEKMTSIIKGCAGFTLEGDYLCCQMKFPHIPRIGETIMISRPNVGLVCQVTEVTYYENGDIRLYVDEY